MEIHAEYEETLRDLIRHLSAGPSASETWNGWQTQQIHEGGNNQLFRATSGQSDFAIKFTIRDERDRAGHEYAALRALQEANLDLAPKPILLDRDSYHQPVVVQSWLPGEMVQEPPRSDEAWSDWLQHIATIHAVTPDQVTVELNNCLGNANGAEGYAREIRRIRGSAAEGGVSRPVMELVEKLECLSINHWPPVPTCLCRADYNVRNLIRHEGTLKSVDWEYAGWGDPAEDMTELITHVTYMDIPDSRREAIIDSFVEESEIDHVRERIEVCVAIKVVAWLVRLARAFEGGGGGESGKLAAETGKWRVDTEEKYRFYLDWARRCEVLSR